MNICFKFLITKFFFMFVKTINSREAVKTNTVTVSTYKIGFRLK